MPPTPRPSPPQQPSDRPAPAAPAPRGPRPWDRPWVRSFLEFTLAITVLALVQAFAVKAYQIPSASMERTLMTGDRILVNRLDDTVGRGDIVVFEHGDTWESTRRSPSDSTTVNVIRVIGSVVGLGPSTRAYTVKRVIATGGEKVACCDDNGHVTVDGVALTEGYLGSDLTFETGTSDCSSSPRSARCFPEITVPVGSLFLLGDNRANSSDSAVSCRGRSDESEECARFVRTDQVVGPVVARFWPPSAIGGVDR
ncbi:MAG: signal peptidase I [Dermatophilaceae bacterium]|nr:signal peptidase I [Intrasporangiaceae bacterium]